MLILNETSAIAIVLVEPQIPQNTGNIMRLCACIGARLYLIGALGFNLQDKFLKRAGMDYLDRVEPVHLASFEALDAELPGWQFVYCTTRAQQSHWQWQYHPNTALVFGSETTGLPAAFIAEHQASCIRIPMRTGERSLNLANSVSIVAYEALRQLSTNESVLFC
ncbi:MAG: tRNA (cytidine(34)-2'-O)-methyltransferase [Vampirovibrionales bacterium]|nr:tRNA (cytidine(34)-2'-O)-methyltransferase [Vampirovibrionales bacterium]